MLFTETFAFTRKATYIWSYMYISCRVPYHREKILQLLLKLVSDLCPDDAHVPDIPGESNGQWNTCTAICSFCASSNVCTNSCNLDTLIAKHVSYSHDNYKVLQMRPRLLSSYFFFMFFTAHSLSGVWKVEYMFNSSTELFILTTKCAECKWYSGALASPYIACSMCTLVNLYIQGTLLAADATFSKIQAQHYIIRRTRHFCRHVHICLYQKSEASLSWFQYVCWLYIIAVDLWRWDIKLLFGMPILAVGLTAHVKGAFFWALGSASALALTA